MADRLHLTWIGHATVLLELDGTRLLIDPLLRTRVGPLRSSVPLPSTVSADATLVSHVHRDHLDLPSLRRLAPTRVVVPRGAGRLIGRRHQVTELTAGQRVEVGAVQVRAWAVSSWGSWSGRRAVRPSARSSRPAPSGSAHSRTG